MNGGEVLVATLCSRDVDTIFFVAGGTYITVMEALSRQSEAIRAVATRLESSAVFAAEAYAALRRRPACVFVSRAPGASNAAIGVHNAMQSSRPLVLFIANIPAEQKQREAFQEIDYALMYQPVAKAVFDVSSFDQLARVTARALDLSVSGRPGPVVVSVSKDVLDGQTGPARVPPRSESVRMAPEPRSLQRAAELIDAARRPLLIAGSKALARAWMASPRQSTTCCVKGSNWCWPIRTLSCLPSGNLKWRLARTVRPRLRR